VNWEEQTHEVLRDAGYRVGAARQAVVSVLARRDCCSTVPELVEALRAEGRGVGIASVYRVVDLLAERGLVQKVDLGDGRARFERAEPADEHHHHHVVCNECGRVEPFADVDLEAALRRVERETGFKVASHDVLLRGACDDCRSAA
jgi:Fur family transcriptional regulator, ferric uptake regulator